MPESAPVVDRLRAVAPNLSVGLLTADLLSLGGEVRLLEAAGVPLVHFDVMDGCFCPLMTMGPPFIRAVKTRMLKDVHLMIDAPLAKLEAFAAAGADLISVSIEACAHPHRVLQVLGRLPNANDPGRPLLRGVGLNPGTPVETVEPLLDELDAVVLLAVNPGWGGQEFIATTPGRLRRLQALTAGRKILTVLDGGVTLRNVESLAGLGADIIVTGSAVFDGKTPAENLRRMLAATVRARTV
jgi:ribulose-phosphate 3-epimerase